MLGPPGFEYLKMRRRVGKGKGREISDWLFASGTVIRMLVPGSPRPLQKGVTLPSGMLEIIASPGKEAWGKARETGKMGRKWIAPQEWNWLRANH